MQHLQQIVLPVLESDISATAIGFKLLIALLIEFITGRASQNVNQQSEPRLLMRTHNARKSFLYKYCPVKTLWRILADITVAAVMVHCLAEIVEQYSSAADLTLCIFLHTVQLLVVDGLLTAVLGKLTQHDDVAHLIEQYRLAGQSVASSTTYLLIIALYALRQVVVHHVAHIALVDAHTEGYRCTHYIYIVIDEFLLHLITLSGRQSGMISLGTHTFLLQFHGYSLSGLSAHTVYNATLIAMTGNEGKQKAQLVLRRISSAYIKRKVRTVEGRNKNLWIARLVFFQTQLLHNIFLGYLVSSSRKGSDWYFREKLFDSAQLRIFRTEIMSPLRDTMCLVYSKHANLERSSRISARRMVQHTCFHLGKQALGRDVKQFVFTTIGSLSYLTVLCLRSIAVQSRSLYTISTQTLHLIFHQRNKRRNHNSRSFHHQCRNLKTKALATTRRHQHKTVFATKNMADYILLQRTKLIVTEIFFKCRLH